MYNRSMTSPWAPPGVNPESAPLRLATAGPIVHTPWVRQRSRADIEAELARETAAVTRAKPPIAVVGAVRLLWIVASVAAIVGLIVDLRQALVAAAIAYGSLVIWSGLAAVNVRRARPATVYAGPPAAASMMSAWLVPVAGAAIAMDIARGAEPFTAVWFGDAAVFGVLVLLGSLVPVALLARLASWAGDRPGEWWQWLIAPVLSLGLSMMLTVLFNVPLSDLLESESTTAASAGGIESSPSASITAERSSTSSSGAGISARLPTSRHSRSMVSTTPPSRVPRSATSRTSTRWRTSGPATISLLPGSALQFSRRLSQVAPPCSEVTMRSMCLHCRAFLPLGLLGEESPMAVISRASAHHRHLECEVDPAAS